MPLPDTLHGFVLPVNKKPKPIKKEIVAICRDCKDGTGKLLVDELDKFTIFNGKVYCNDCISEMRQTCENCGSKESSRSEFESYNITGAGISKLIVLCNKCARNTRRCFVCQCMSLSELAVHKECEFTLCKDCIENHHCPSDEPKYLFRKYSTRKYTGKISTAKKIKSPRYVGVELEMVDGDPKKIVGLDERLGIGHDGSLKGKSPIEVQTPPCSASELENIIDSATNSLRAAGYGVNKSCGMHIHVDSADFAKDPKKILQVLATYYAVEPIIVKMLPKSRRSGRYSLPLRYWIDEVKMMRLIGMNPTMEQIEAEWYKARTPSQAAGSKAFKWDSSRYHGVNFHSLFTMGHLEIRHHHGTLNATKIKNWIVFHISIIDWAVNQYDRGLIESVYAAEDINSKLRLMVRNMGLSKETRRYILRSMRKFEGVEEDNI